VSIERVQFGFGTGAPDEDSGPRPVPQGTPFRILVLGGFSGEAGQGGPLRARPVDRDNFDDLLARLAPTVTVPQVGEAAAPVTLRFASLDDFHPDAIYARAPVFERLRSLRRRLKNPDTFAEAAREMGAVGEAPTEAPEPEGGPSVPLPDDLLQAALAETEAHPEHFAGAEGDRLADDLIRQALAGHVIPAPDPRTNDLVDAVDAATAETLRALLHHPAVQALEAAWRGLYFLVRRLETDARLQLHMADLPPAALRAELERERAEEGDLFKLLVEETVQTPGAEPWALVAGLYTFDATPEDAAHLARLGALAGAAGAPLLAAAHPHLAGCESFGATPDPDDWHVAPDPEAADAWDRLRRTAAAGHLALVAPRFLLRLPYGKGTAPVEAFAFEEAPPEAGHEALLWGSGALAAACLLGTAFTRDGWALNPRLGGELDGLPVHNTVDADGDPVARPCAEIVLTERGGARLAEAGVTPLWSVRSTDRVRMGGPTALDGNPLKGAWGA
jgi:type VI secretion system protein ImpC